MGSSRRDWTTAFVSWQVRTSSVWSHLTKVYRTRTLPLPTAGLFPHASIRHDTLFPGSMMIGRMIAPLARMILFPPAPLQKTTFSDVRQHRVGESITESILGRLMKCITSLGMGLRWS